MSVHWLDRLAAVQAVRRIPRLFEEGWGDLDLLERVGASIRGQRPADEVEPTWSSWRAESDLVARVGWFQSPAADLPPESRRAVVQMVAPHPEPERVAVLFAAHNDHGYDTRMRLARRLGRSGIATVLLENPFYGRRRPLGAGRQPVRTVADLLVMGRAAVDEGRALVGALRRHEAIVGVSGYSMGGTIAALVAAQVDLPVAAAPLAAAHSPGPVYTEGVLSAAVAWEALGGPEARHRLGEVLDWASVLRHPAPPHTARAVLAAPAADGYVPRRAIEAVHRHWPGSELRWLPGGHSSVVVFSTAVMATVVRDSFARLTSGQPSTSEETTSDTR